MGRQFSHGLDRDLCLGGFGAQPIGGLRAGGQAPTRRDTLAAEMMRWRKVAKETGVKVQAD
jgi:hypothetical protein